MVAPQPYSTTHPTPGQRSSSLRRSENGHTKSSGVAHWEVNTVFCGDYQKLCEHLAEHLRIVERIVGPGLSNATVAGKFAEFEACSPKLKATSKIQCAHGLFDR